MKNDFYFVSVFLLLLHYCSFCTGTALILIV